MADNIETIDQSIETKAKVNIKVTRSFLKSFPTKQRLLIALLFIIIKEKITMPPSKHYNFDHLGAYIKN